MAKIQLMPPELANMIAAGEVIERPSSVIKELVENSIDANASHIDIQIFSYGKELISVKDDGCGMGREDAIMAFKRHATSKVKSIYDLMRITTLGFRGEAIPSIASVSHVSMFTSDGAEVGTSIVSEPGAELKIQDASLRKGTLFEIRELFYNTPARLKFLKEERTENLSSIETVQHLAIGFPEIAFSLFIDGKKSFSTTGRGSLLETIACIYGNDIAKKCLPFHISTVSYSADGFIVHPSISYSSKYDILTFMNNRSVYIPRVQKAIIDGYRDYLPPTRYPMAIIPIKVDYALVDVNVHPTKKEVRLSCEINLANDIHKQVQIVLASTRGEFDDAKMKTENNSVTRSGDGNVSPLLIFYKYAF
jgi:DNA mismatch repair protein MutL